MCGGIVGAFSSIPQGANRFPVPVKVHARTPVGLTLLRVLAYNLGRIGSYAAAGAMAGGLARGALKIAGLSSWQMLGYWLVNLMLVALGLYLMGVWRGLTYLELAGRGIWRHLQPLTKRLLPIDSSFKLFLAGALWGWLP